MSNTLPYFLYSNGKLKKVEREEPDKFPTLQERFRNNGEWAAYDRYIENLPAIEVHEDLKKVWKDGKRYYEGKDFKLGTLWARNTDRQMPTMADLDDYAIPLPVASEESQEDIWDDVEGYITTFTGATKMEAVRLCDKLKSNYIITRIKK